MMAALDLGTMPLNRLLPLLSWTMISLSRFIRASFRRSVIWVTFSVVSVIVWPFTSAVIRSFLLGV